MALEPVPASSASDGRWRITYVPVGGNALSVAILNGGTSKPITYSLTPDGYNHAISQAEATDPRLTLIQNLNRPGKVTETLEIKYVASADANSADTLFVAGLEGQLNVRRGVDNATVATVGQKADVVTFQAGVKRPDPPTENGVDTVSQTLYITAPTVRGALIVA